MLVSMSSPNGESSITQVEWILLQPTRDLVGSAVHIKVMHNGSMLLQQSTPETLQLSKSALMKSRQVEKNAFSSCLLEQAMILSVLVAQERELLHSKACDMTPEYQPHVTSFSIVVVIRASTSFLPRLLDMTFKGGGVVVGEVSDSDPKTGL